VVTAVVMTCEGGGGRRGDGSWPWVAGGGVLTAALVAGGWRRRPW
jgi:hypothetical protein